LLDQAVHARNLYSFSPGLQLAEYPAGALTLQRPVACIRVPVIRNGSVQTLFHRSATSLRKSALKQQERQQIVTLPELEKGKIMPLLQVVLVLIVVGVLLWLVDRFIPMASSIKSILNAVVTIAVVLWLLNIFGLLHYLSDIHIGKP
jgi:hypothetical protein